MISDIQKDKNGFFFTIGKCVYRCDDYDALSEVKNQLIKEQFVAMSEYKQRIQKGK